MNYRCCKCPVPTGLPGFLNNTTRFELFGVPRCLTCNGIIKQSDLEVPRSEVEKTRSCPEKKPVMSTSKKRDP